MSKVHVCQLALKDTAGLPKLPPNACFTRRLFRKFRELIIVNPRNFKCKSFSNTKSAIMAEQRRHIKSLYCYMIHPFSNLNSFLEVIFFLLWFSKMVGEPIGSNLRSFNNIIQLIHRYPVVILQRGLIISFFFVGYLDPITKQIVLDCRRVAERYVKSFFFIDLLATELPLLTKAVRMFYPSYKHDLKILKVLKLVDYAHVIFLFARLNTIAEFLDNIGQMLSLKKKIRKCMVYILKTFMYLHLASCVLYYIPQVIYDKEYPSDSWLVMAKISPKQERRLLKIYGECLLMTVCYFFGASPGRYEISQTNEQICLSFISLFGRLYTLFLTADALQTFGISDISEGKYERTLSELREYMCSKDLPPSLRNRMSRYYEYKLQMRYFDEAEIHKTLSRRLRHDIYLFSARTLMAKSTFMKYLSHHDAVTLISMMKLVTYAPGDYIYSVGQKVNEIFFISSGSVLMRSADGYDLCHLEDGEAFGIRTFSQLQASSLEKRKLNAIALETTDVFQIDIAILYNFLQQYPQAIVYLRGLASERKVFYANLYYAATETRTGCLFELRSGKLLEKKKRQIFVM